MKKKINKKLNLNKNTVMNIGIEERKTIKGGFSVFFETCYCYTEHKSCSLYINCCPPPEKLDNETKYYC